MSLMQVLPLVLQTSITQGLNASPLQLAVSAYGVQEVSPVITSDSGWLTPSPAQVNSTGNVEMVNLVFSTTALAVGTFVATLSIVDENADNSPITVKVTLFVTAIPVPPHIERFERKIYQANRLQPVGASVPWRNRQ
jgi:hypothetical protein